jgi:hypothetical protein
MTMLDTAPGLVLPDYLALVDAADVYPSTDYGRRSISWTLRPPGGVLHRNTYCWAWLTVREDVAWRGEPLHLLTERRAEEHTMRDNFTSKGREALAAEILPPLARYGFDRLWTQLHRLRVRPDGATRQAESLAADAKWWAHAAELQQMHADGALEFIPLPRLEIGKREPMVRIPVKPGYHSSFATPACKALLGDEQVGWMTTEGEIIPLDHTPGAP